MACYRLNIERIISEKYVVVNRSGEVLLSYKKYHCCPVKIAKYHLNSNSRNTVLDIQALI